MDDNNFRDSQSIFDDLTVACNSLGKLDVNDGVYMKDRECKACLKEIIRILHNDTKKHQARITLGKYNIVRADLIPLIVQYCDFNDGDRELFTLILKLATNITSSVLLIFDEMPTEPESIKTYNQILEGLSSYKEAFADDPRIWHTLNTYLRHLDDDETLFERVLILIRNILHIPVDVSADLGVKGGSNAHELCVNHMAKSGILQTFVQVASETKKGTEFCFHIIEIVYLILRDQNPITVASATQPNTLKRKLEADDPDKKKLLELLARDKMEREVKERSARIPRFKGTVFSVSNLTGLGHNPMVTGRIVKSRDDISYDSKKTQLRKAKNKKPLPKETNSAFQSDENTTTTSVTASVKMFSKLFVEKVYANYMQQIKFNLMQKKAAENDETYYLWAIQYFMPFSRHLYLDLSHISETLSTSTIHYIQILITDYQERLKLEKKRSQYEKISQRLHLAIRAYKEILATYQFVKPDSDLYGGIEATKKTIFSEIEYNTLIVTQFRHYVSSKHSPGYLRDLIKTNHVYLELIEDYHKSLNDPMLTTHFVNNYCIPEILSAYSETLRDFKTNETALNLNILKFFERVVHDCKNEVMLMQASLLRCLLEIHDYHPSFPGYHGFVALTKHVMAAFGEMIHKKRWVMQELLFWKTRNDVIEIENAVDPPMGPVAQSPRHDDLGFELNNPTPTGERAADDDNNVVKNNNDENLLPDDDVPPGDSIEDLMAELGSESSFHSEHLDDGGVDDDDDEVPANGGEPQTAEPVVEQQKELAAGDDDGGGDDDDDEIITSARQTSNKRNRLSSESDIGDDDHADEHADGDDDDDDVESASPPSAKKGPSLVYPSDSDDLSSPPSPLPSPDTDNGVTKLSDIPAINEDSD
uniref:Protein timeless n=1 Tax=Aceria tosichella TaxID=561515 RepID=A0A6G1SJT6_9ACAR